MSEVYKRIKVICMSICVVFECLLIYNINKMFGVLEYQLFIYEFIRIYVVLLIVFLINIVCNKKFVQIKKK